MEKFISEDITRISSESISIVSENEKVITALEQLEVHLSSSAEKNDTVKLLNEIKELQAKKLKYPDVMIKFTQLSLKKNKLNAN